MSTDEKTVTMPYSEYEMIRKAKFCIIEERSVFGDIYIHPFDSQSDAHKAIYDRLMRDRDIAWKRLDNKDQKLTELQSQLHRIDGKLPKNKQILYFLYGATFAFIVCSVLYLLK